jgi:Predicted membrane protein (DUF2079)
MKFKIRGLLIVLCSITLLLVLSSVVPNSFSISLVGLLFSVALLFHEHKKNIKKLNTPHELSYSNVNISNAFLVPLKTERIFMVLFALWLLLFGVSVAFHAHWRFFSPGYDLAWFSQAITNAKNGDGLWVSFERPISHLVQHWEPALYSAIPLSYFFSARVSVVVWQFLGFTVGAFGAWKLAKRYFVFQHSATLLAVGAYLFFWPIVNPLQFDVHPPAFGAPLFFPWIFLFLLKNHKTSEFKTSNFKNNLIVFVLLIALMQCGEIFFAVCLPYLAFLFFRNLKTKHFLPTLLIFSFLGYVLVAAYQRYFGPWLTGNPFPFASRYEKMGGDGFGILKNSLQNPLQLVSLFVSLEKIKTFSKALFYLGPFPFMGAWFLFQKSKNLCLTVLFGLFPYFIKVGASQTPEMLNTVTHYIAEFGPQYWFLFLVGLKYATQNHFIHNKRHLLAWSFCLLFLNSSEWRKSPLEIFRSSFDSRTLPPPEFYEFVKQIPNNAGVVLLGAEWLCPIVVEHKKWVACEGYIDKIIPKMPSIDVFIGTSEALLNKLSKGENFKHLEFLMVLANATNEQNSVVGWKKIMSFEQVSKKRTVHPVSVWVANTQKE